MDRKIRRNEFNDKKIDYKVKDSGDAGKKTYNSEGTMIADYFGRGDSVERKISATNQTSEHMSLNVDKTKSTNEDPKFKYLIHGTAEKDLLPKNLDRSIVGKSYSEIRKRIRDKYTFKYNVPVNKSDHLSLYKSSKGGKVILNGDGNNPPIIIRVPTDPAKIPAKPLPEETSKIIEKQTRPPSGQSDVDKKSESIPENKSEKIPVKPDKNPVKPDKVLSKPRWKTNSPKKRKPIIKTVVSKTDSARIFKAVTFVDNVNSTPLEIKIPGENIIIKKQHKVSKYTETTPLKLKPKPNPNLPTVRTIKYSKESIKIEGKQSAAVVRKKPAERKKCRKFRNLSPEFTKAPACPQTEVARWAPASFDSQTQPYYDAWVDTTLTATTKHSKKDKSLYDYQMRLFKSFKRAMEERPESPDLFYDKFADERYAGRIKIKQTERRRGKM